MPPAGFEHNCMWPTRIAQEEVPCALHAVEGFQVVLSLGLWPRISGVGQVVVGCIHSYRCIQFLVRVHVHVLRRKMDRDCCAEGEQGYWLVLCDLTLRLLFRW